MRFALFALLVAGCAESKEGWWFTAHITSTAEFDTAVVTVGSFDPDARAAGGLVTKLDYDWGDPFNAASTMSVTIERGGTPIATANVAEIPYHDDDGGNAAEFTVPVNP